METLKSKVVIANSSYGTTIENLRSISYHNSAGFKIVDEKEFEGYCKWSTKDTSGIVLLALSESNEPLSCLRGNVYYTSDELEKNNLNFKDNCSNFIIYPVLDMTFASTSPKHFQNGLLSVLRYYMYIIHKHSVKTISGTAVKNSSIYNTLEKFGYEFREIEKVRKEMLPVDTMTIAKIDTAKLEFAIRYLKSKYAEVIYNFPLVVT